MAYACLTGLGLVFFNGAYKQKFSGIKAGALVVKSHACIAEAVAQAANSNVKA